MTTRRAIHSPECRCGSCERKRKSEEAKAPAKPRKQRCAKAHPCGKDTCKKCNPPEPKGDGEINDTEAVQGVIDGTDSIPDYGHVPEGPPPDDPWADELNDLPDENWPPKQEERGNLKVTVKLPTGIDIEFEVRQLEDLAASGVDPEPIKRALLKVLAQADFSVGATAETMTPMAGPVSNSAPSEQSDPWMATAPQAQPQQPPPVQLPQQPPMQQPFIQQQPQQMPQQQMAPPQQQYPQQQQMAQQQAVPQSGIVTVQTQNGPQTWTLNPPGAPPCHCGMQSALVQGIGKNQRQYRAYRCAKGATNDWRNKCQFNQFTN